MGQSSPDQRQDSTRIKKKLQQQSNENAIVVDDPHQQFNGHHVQDSKQQQQQQLQILNRHEDDHPQKQHLQHEKQPYHRQHQQAHLPFPPSQVSFEASHAMPRMPVISKENRSKSVGSVVSTSSSNVSGRWNSNNTKGEFSAGTSTRPNNLNSNSYHRRDAKSTVDASNSLLGRNVPSTTIFPAHSPSTNSLPQSPQMSHLSQQSHQSHVSQQSHQSHQSHQSQHSHQPLQLPPAGRSSGGRSSSRSVTSNASNGTVRKSSRTSRSTSSRQDHPQRSRSQTRGGRGNSSCVSVERSAVRHSRSDVMSADAPRRRRSSSSNRRHGHYRHNSFSNDIINHGSVQSFDVFQSPSNHAMTRSSTRALNGGGSDQSSIVSLPHFPIDTQDFHRASPSSMSTTSAAIGKSRSRDRPLPMTTINDSGTGFAVPSPSSSSLAPNTLVTNSPTKSAGSGTSSNVLGMATTAMSGSAPSPHALTHSSAISHCSSITNQSVGMLLPTQESSPSRTHELMKVHSKMARKVVDELNRAHGSTDRRIAALTNACAVFDHDDEHKHNIELYYGAGMALTKLLIVSQKDDELRIIISAFEMVFRASPKQCCSAFGKISHSLLSNLLRILDRLEARGSNVKHGDVNIVNISRILYYLSRSSELRPILCRPKSMLQALARLSTKTMNSASRLLRLKIIANLSNCEENKIILYEHEGIVDSLLRVGHFDSNDLVRQLASTALMELSTAPSNQVFMALNEVLVSTVVKIVLLEKGSVTRECGITTLKNLAFRKENRLTLVKFKDGILLEALKKVLATEPDAKSRRRAAGALTNLACDETAKVMGNHQGLVNTLAIVATKDENSEVQRRAALALTKIATSVTVDMYSHETILDALVVTSLSKTSHNVAAVFRLKARAPENREALARHSGVIDTLCDIIMSDGALETDRDNAIRAMMHLVNEDRNRKVLCNKTVLDALVHAANYNGASTNSTNVNVVSPLPSHQHGLLEDARDSAIRALERLATDSSNRPFMAHHPGLIVSVARQVEREAILERQGRESEHGYLAKPLLLSLLVAM